MLPDTFNTPANPLLVALVGPTGSGKTSLALHLAGHFPAEIVNCDSIQLYKGFDIGSAKLPPSQRRGVPHHLFDALEPHQVYSAGEYAREAREVVARIRDRGKLPLITGGTGFYLRAFLQGLPPLPERNEDLRARLLAREQRRAGSLHRILRRLDPAAARVIHHNDVQKLIRAVELRMLTQAPRPASEMSEPLQGFRIMKIGLNPDRAELHKILDSRTVEMFGSGLADEVRSLLANGCTGNEKPFESLGYKQALAYLRGEMTIGQAIESTTIQTRQYARRQLTWFRREPDVHWLGGFGNDPRIMDRAVALVNPLLH